MVCKGYLDYVTLYCLDGVNSYGTNGWTQGCIVGVVTWSVITPVVCEVNLCLSGK